MKLSISNIAWKEKDDERIFSGMKKNGFSGLEIAPTRIIPENPYDNTGKAVDFFRRVKKDYGFSISSMQSIWFGRGEQLFGSEAEEEFLINYTKKAIDFAKAIGCGNLVFGCPKNRVLPEGENPERALSFFKELGEHAKEKGTVIGMEANPPVYGTNFINTTEDAFELISEVNSEGFKLNLDTGTMIINGESPKTLMGRVHYINHVHISEPEMAPIKERELHREIIRILKEENYDGYVSIEMKTAENAEDVERAMDYIGDLLKSEV